MLNVGGSQLSLQAPPLLKAIRPVFSEVLAAQPFDSLGEFHLLGTCLRIKGSEGPDAVELFSTEAKRLDIGWLAALGEKVDNPLCLGEVRVAAALKPLDD